jgi:IS30 family transposase
MGRKYTQLSATERNDLHSRMLNGESLRSIARVLGRSASTLSREISRNSEEGEESTIHALQGMRVGRVDAVAW